MRLREVRGEAARGRCGQGEETGVRSWLGVAGVVPVLYWGLVLSSLHSALVLGYNGALVLGYREEVAGAGGAV